MGGRRRRTRRGDRRWKEEQIGPLLRWLYHFKIKVRFESYASIYHVLKRQNGPPRRKINRSTGTAVKHRDLHFEGLGS